MTAAEEPAQKPKPNGLAQAIASSDRFRASTALGPGAILDAGLPLVLFTAIYFLTDHNLTVAIWSALGSGALLAIIRLARREQLQNVIAGFVGLGLAAFLAYRTGRAQDIFLTGFAVNIGYGLAYLISIVVRWPLLGLIVGLVTGQGTSWRRDPALFRAYMKASALWVVMFALRLAVQVPLYLAGEDQLGWLASARLAMSWPLFLLTAYLSWVIIRPAYQAHQEREKAIAAASANPDADS
jgi:hypothetical protein